MRVLHRVREVLGLQTEAAAVGINRPALAADVGRGQKVAGIKLQPRLGGAAVQQDAAGWAVHPGAELAVWFLQNIVVVIAGAVFQVDARVVEVLPDRGEAAEIHRRPLRAVQRDNPSGRQAVLVVLGEAVRKNLDALPLHAAAVVPVQIKVGVVGQVDDRVAVAQRPVEDGQAVLLVEGIFDRDDQIARIALLPVGAEVGKDHALLVGNLPVPQPPVKAGRPAVQVVGAVVDRKMVLLPSQGKSAPADAVGVAARHRAKAGGLPLIVLDAVAPQHDVPQLSLAVLHPGRDHRRAVVGQADRGPLRVCDGIQKGRAAVT